MKNVWLGHLSDCLHLVMAFFCESDWLVIRNVYCMVPLGKLVLIFWSSASRFICKYDPFLSCYYQEMQYLLGIVAMRYSHARWHCWCEDKGWRVYSSQRLKFRTGAPYSPVDGITEVSPPYFLCLRGMYFLSTPTRPAQLI